MIKFPSSNFSFSEISEKLSPGTLIKVKGLTYWTLEKKIGNDSKPGDSK